MKCDGETGESADMKREVERETDDRGQRELIKCRRLEMLSRRRELIDSNVLERRRPDESHSPREDKAKISRCGLASALSYNLQHGV